MLQSCDVRPPIGMCDIHLILVTRFASGNELGAIGPALKSKPCRHLTLSGFHHRKGMRNLMPRKRMAEI